MYAQVFPEMIKAWRSAFKDPAMPFGILSLCTAGTLQTRDNYLELMADAGPFIREAQYKTFLDLYRGGDKNIGFVGTYDLRRRWYHPQLKIPAGMRIARWALSTQYGLNKTLRWKPPMVEEMTTEEGRILLRLDESVGAVDNGGPIEGFSIAGEDRRFHPADAEALVTGKDSKGRPKKDQKTLVLSSPLVPNPMHYRYAWARNPMGNLQAHHNTDVPFATQRSDAWGMTEVPIPFGETLDRQMKGEVRRALRLEDMRRRLFEAEALLEKERESFEKEWVRWKEKWEK
jgi:sialate O-acetylesterase